MANNVSDFDERKKRDTFKKTHIFKDGILFKCRDYMSGWRPRYFTLDKRFLHYYLDADDALPRGSFQLVRGMAIESLQPNITASKLTYYPFLISHPSSETTIKLSTPSLEERAAWILAFQQAQRASNLSTNTPAQDEEWDKLTETESSFPIDKSISTRISNKIAADFESRNESSNVITEDGMEIANREETLQNIPEAFSSNLNKAAKLILNSVSSNMEWEHMSEQDGVRTSRIVEPGGPIFVRGETFLPYSITEIFKVTSNEHNRKKLDNQLGSYTRLKWFARNTGLEHLKFKAVWPTQARDFCNITHWRLLQDGTLITLGYRCDPSRYRFTPHFFPPQFCF